MVTTRRLRKARSPAREAKNIRLQWKQHQEAGLRQREGCGLAPAAEGNKANSVRKRFSARGDSDRVRGLFGPIRKLTNPHISRQSSESRRQKVEGRRRA